ncbi:MlaA family lipoprotein [Beijerinckia indica]|uniref:VacJ family lipoprotein n=1 Tax=Beijerinckia indica subsp. indica (strain ATCC 9039 / DSM 1715 / NCIMB 8712) TaxID=395963 RepID=B2IIX5_BEII9|nr:VacJ family lipoprotein [Beijerinckia indica]ACB96187.1 VacJ family lipoprotein [Beijerinckia indica subsp. indica ATCC 9039]
MFLSFVKRCACVSIFGSFLVHPVYATDLENPSNQEPHDSTQLRVNDSTNDPAESVNRTIFKGNKAVDDYVMRPIARTYLDYVPEGARKSIQNFVRNTGEPTVFVNDVLQGNGRRAWNTTQRFAINTTVGAAGLFDVASMWEKPFHKADLGQTFGVWGIDAGPSVQLPLLGPSNVRDTVAAVVTSVASPFGFVHGGAMNVVSYAQKGVGGVGAVNSRAESLSKTDALEKSSQDYYASTRLVKARERAKLIEEGKIGLVSQSGSSIADAPNN